MFSITTLFVPGNSFVLLGVVESLSFSIEFDKDLIMLFFFGPRIVLF